MKRGFLIFLVQLPRTTWAQSKYLLKERKSYGKSWFHKVHHQVWKLSLDSKFVRFENFLKKLCISVQKLLTRQKKYIYCVSERRKYKSCILYAFPSNYAWFSLSFPVNMCPHQQNIHQILTTHPFLSPLLHFL